MAYVIAILAALAAASIPLALQDWSKGEKAMAEAMGLTHPRRRVSLEQIARESGAGVSGTQIIMGVLAWSIGGFLLGLPEGIIAALLFGAAGALIYIGSLKDKRELRRGKQAVQVARAMGVIEVVLSQGRSLQEALEQAAEAVPEEGREVLQDLVRRIREAPADQMARAVREWDAVWDNPAVDMLAAALLAAIEGRMEIAPLIAALRTNIQDVIEVLERTRAEAAGVIWESRFLAFWPVVVLAILALMIPDWAAAYRQNPLYLLPALLGSWLTWALSMRLLRKGLSVDAAVGIGERGEGEIQLDRLGRVI